MLAMTVWAMSVDREAKNRYCFKVPRQATKQDIARAVAEVFNVKVVAVHTMNMEGKEKRLGRNIGRRSSWKKAIVTLAEGHKVQLMVVFRGRMLSHRELGIEIINKFLAHVQDIARIDQDPRLEGKRMHAMLSPINKH